MAVVERCPELEGLQHVAFQVDIALEVGLGDISFVERAQRPQGPLVAQTNLELRLAVAEIAFLTVGQLDGERCRDLPDAADQGVERGGG